MERMYFNPGCALCLYKPEMEQKILPFLRQVYPDIALHKICCHHEPGLDGEACIVNICAGCDKRFSSLYPGVRTISLWEVLDQADHFPYPDYQGQTMTIHDPCPVRERPAVHTAIRSLLDKMNIKVVEAKQNRQNAPCCGDAFYPDFPLSEVHAKMKARADDMPVEEVVVYCVSCIKAMHIGGKTSRYMVDLLFGEPTSPGVYDTVEWHKQVQAYIDEH
ncbi:MAG: (Fe-S)-binding protein [Oscillospiraceae bacterium]|nr:(Fe-S)-binding protein [Oscillospiraceae bacterium]